MQALTLSLNGQVSGGGMESSGWGLQFVPSEPVSNYALFPGVSIDFAPGGLMGLSEFDANQQTSANNGISLAIDTLQFSVTINGTSSSSFLLLPGANSMSLSVGAGDSGQVSLRTDAFAGGIDQLTGLLDFEFQQGLVTVSANSLGLSLPAVGSSPNFLLNSVAPFEASLPPIDPGNFQNILTSDVEGQRASLGPVSTPEPRAFLPTLAALGILLLRLATHQKR